MSNDIRYETVLVPTDGSDAAAEAVDHAIGIAKQYGATLHALFVVDARTLGGDLDSTMVYNALEDQGRAVLDRVADRARTDGVTAVETELLTGKAHSQIVDYADECDADLIVMGTHGRRGLDRYLLGSVTEKVVRVSPRPVLTVHAESESDEGDESGEDPAE